MRKYITEREVYKKLKVLERHSSYKKPYFNFKSHPHGELRYSWPGFPAHDRPPGPGFPGALGPQYGDCELACLGGILDCEEGGCDPVTCICGEPPYYIDIIEDPTGQAWTENVVGSVADGTQNKNYTPGESNALGGFPAVCIPEDALGASQDGLEFPEIVAVVSDQRGQRSLVTFPVVDCKPDCCEDLSLTGADTVNPGATWTGSIVHGVDCCEDMDLQVTSNSGCTIGGVLDELCHEVLVSVGDSDCGSFTVTITDQKEGCPGETAEKTVRINNTGQGGAWTPGTPCSINPPGCNAPFTGACYNHGTVINGSCIVEDLRYVFSRQSCSTNLPGLGCLTGCQFSSCPASCSGPPCDNPGQNNRPCSCTGAGKAGWFWDVRIDTWECTCP